MYGYRTATLFLGAILVAASAAAAQVHVVGRVVENETSDPIVGVDITVRGPAGGYLGHRVTDENGAFQYEASRISGIKLRAQRLGYRPNTTPVLFFDNHDFYEVEIRLDRDAVLLAPLEVIARSAVESSPVLADFRHRLEHGMGRYLTRDEIEARNPSFVSDMLLEIPGVRLQAGGTGTRRIVRMRANCPAQIFVDGVLMNPAGYGTAVTVDDVVSPRNVEAIEVYGGLGSVPAAFLNENSHCGVVAIWTRRGS